MSLEQEAVWLAERKKGIGGSDAGAVLATGYGCPRALFLYKTGVEPDYAHTPQEKNNFRRGHAFEPLVADRFIAETGAWVTHALCPGEGKKFSNTWTNGASRWDTRALEADHPELADKYKRRGEGGIQLRSYDLNARDAA